MREEGAGRPDDDEEVSPYLTDRSPPFFHPPRLPLEQLHVLFNYGRYLCRFSSCCLPPCHALPTLRFLLPFPFVVNTMPVLSVSASRAVSVRCVSEEGCK